MATYIGLINLGFRKSHIHRYPTLFWCASQKHPIQNKYLLLNLLHIVWHSLNSIMKYPNAHLLTILRFCRIHHWMLFWQWHHWLAGTGAENLKQFHLKWENYNHWKWARSIGGFSSALWRIRSCCGPVFAIHKPYFVWCGVGATPKCRFTGNRREIKRSSRKNREKRNLEESLCYEFREDKMVMSQCGCYSQTPGHANRAVTINETTEYPLWMVSIH